LKDTAVTEKPILYLLPGLLCDATVWTDVAAGLNDLAEIRTPDFLGQDSITIMAQSVLDTAPPSFSVVGHSMGARVALEIVRMAPERVERLALLDTGTHARREGEGATRQVLVDLARNEGMQALASRWLPPMVHPDTRHDGPLMKSLRAMVGRATPEIFAGQVRALLGRPDADRVLPLIECPVLIGVGRQDAWSPPSQHEAMAKAIPHADYVVFENSGHMAPMEAPDAVIAALRTWLTTKRKTP
jgi:pimeloyl-ACP methyl ester carboxylesterase